MAHGRAACLRLRRTWDVYAQIVVSASVGPGAVHAIASALGRGDDAVAVFTSLGGVETAGTAQQVWELSWLVRRSPRLTAAFDEGTADLLDRLDAASEPDAAGFAAGFRSLLAEYGHRGPNEWDLASDTWLTRPAIALGMIDRIRLQDDEQSPAERAAAGAALRERTTAELAALVSGDEATLATLSAAIRPGQQFYRTREAGKDAAVRVMLEAKLPFFELGRHLQERGVVAQAAHVFQLLDSELDELLAQPDGWSAVLAERAAVRAARGAGAAVHRLARPSGAADRHVAPARPGARRCPACRGGRRAHRERRVPGGGQRSGPRRLRRLGSG